MLNLIICSAMFVFLVIAPWIFTQDAITKVASIVILCLFCRSFADVIYLQLAGHPLPAAGLTLGSVYVPRAICTKDNSGTYYSILQNADGSLQAFALVEPLAIGETYVATAQGETKILAIRK